MARGGPRPGSGRKVGGKNKATIEREARAAELAALALAQNEADDEHDANVASMGGDVPTAAAGAAPVPRRRKKLAKDVLEELMLVGLGYAARFQPKYAPDGKVLEGDPVAFREWADFTGDKAAKLAKYQSPTFRAIHLQADSGSGAGTAPPQPGDNAKVVDMQSERDPARAIEAYARIIAKPREAA